ncbi:MAG: hypothetical protein ACP5T0_05250 [Verrucomicrobiia bacterium]
MPQKDLKRGEIVIYKSRKGPEIMVHLEGTSVWLRQNEIARLYGKDRSVITKHINKIFPDMEVDKKAMCIFAHCKFG